MRFRLLGGQKKVPRQFFALFQAGKTSLQIYIEPAHGGRYENGACFYQPPFLSGKFTLKILTLQTYLVGEDKKTLTIFSTLAKNSVKFFSQKGFTMAFLLLFANILDLCRQPPRHAP